MSQTYVVCETCNRMNRVRLDKQKPAVCGACKAALPVHGAIQDVSDRSFQKLIQLSPLPVVVDVWAPWCAPCLAFAPTFKEMGEQTAGKMVFAKLNSEANPQTASVLGIRSIPTLLVFKKGVEVSRQSGAMPREMFQQWLQNSPD